MDNNADVATPRIKLFVTDLDGCLTNGHMMYDHTGKVSKSYHTRDITALWLLQQAGIKVLGLTGSNHACDRHRFMFLANIEDEGVDPGARGTPSALRLGEVLLQGQHNKLEALTKYMAERAIGWSDVAYIGDAMNDYECLCRAGWSACPKDAEDEIKAVAHYVSSFKGGHCAVRDFANMVISANKTR